MQSESSEELYIQGSGSFGVQYQNQELFDIVYSELRRVAAWHISRASESITLGATDLMHEAIARVLAQRNRAWTEKTHLLAIGSLMIRRVLINHIRDRGALKRGGACHVSRIDPETTGKRELLADEMLEIHEAITRLEGRSWKQARIVEMKYFGGLGTCDIARVLGMSERSIQIEWKHAKLWLRRELAHD